MSSDTITTTVPKTATMTTVSQTISIDSATKISTDSSGSSEVSDSSNETSGKYKFYAGSDNEDYVRRPEGNMLMVEQAMKTFNYPVEEFETTSVTIDENLVLVVEIFDTGRYRCKLLFLKDVPAKTYATAKANNIDIDMLIAVSSDSDSVPNQQTTTLTDTQMTEKLATLQLNPDDDVSLATVIQITALDIDVIHKIPAYGCFRRSRETFIVQRTGYHTEVQLYHKGYKYIILEDGWKTLQKTAHDLHLDYVYVNEFYNYKADPQFFRTQLLFYLHK